VTDLVWYAGYGSNLSRDRFSCYIAGGTPAGTIRTYDGCRDRTPPRRTTALRFPGALAFAGESTVWGGGTAFLDPGGDNEVVARAYLVTVDQLDDVAAQETRYDGVFTVGDRDGVPVVALTSSVTHEPAAPSAAYLRTLLGGLTDGLLGADEAIAYLLAVPGVDLVWDEATIRALAEQPVTGRS
jgi:hypothetical protein